MIESGGNGERDRLDAILRAADRSPGPVPDHLRQSILSAYEERRIAADGQGSQTAVDRRGSNRWTVFSRFAMAAGVLGAVFLFRARWTAEEEGPGRADSAHPLERLRIETESQTDSASPGSHLDRIEALSHELYADLATSALSDLRKTLLDFEEKPFEESPENTAEESSTELDSRDLEEIFSEYPSLQTPLLERDEKVGLLRLALLEQSASYLDPRDRERRYDELNRTYPSSPIGQRARSRRERVREESPR